MEIYLTIAVIINMNRHIKLGSEWFPAEPTYEKTAGRWFGLPHQITADNKSLVLVLLLKWYMLR